MFIYDTVSHLSQYHVPCEVNCMHRSSDLGDLFDLIECERLLEDTSAIHHKETQRYDETTQAENGPFNIKGHLDAIGLCFFHVSATKQGFNIGTILLSLCFQELFPLWHRPLKTYEPKQFDLLLFFLRFICTHYYCFNK